MKLLLSLSRLIDTFTEQIGKITYWLVLIAVLISAGNAIARYSLNISSNAWLEIQWYLFSAIFLFCSGYTLLYNQHVRIDVVSNHFNPRTRAWIDIFGTLFFLMPMALIILWLSWPVFLDAYYRHEVSSNAGGLIVWPARLMIPVGFLFLILQGLSELIKRFAFLYGLIPDPNEKSGVSNAEKLLAEDIHKQQGEMHD